MLTFYLFGPPQILHDGQALSVTRRKSRALIYYLAAHARPQPRDHLLLLFWPDLERPAAQQALRTTLHSLRQALGPSLLVAESTLALAPETFVDARQFEAQLAAASATATSIDVVLDLYRGDFLDGLSLPDAPAFDDWVAAERERYRRLAVRGLTALAREHEERGQFVAALDALDRALGFDPLQEDLQRAAMRLHYFAGDRAGAIRRFEGLRRLLDDEMGVPPMAETLTLYEAIITDALQRDEPARRPAEERAQREISRGSSASPALLALLAAPALPFAGRTSELQKLRALAAAPPHKLALLEGEAGIGKTRLAAECLRSSDSMVLVGAARELEQHIPYQPIIEALRGLLARPDWPTLRNELQKAVPPIWLAETARLLPELAPEALPTAAPDESRLWEGVHQFLCALASRRSLIVFLDDLHWADGSTLALLGYLVRQNTMPILYLAATRPLAPRAPLTTLAHTLIREDRLIRISLTRLSSEDVVAIARAIGSPGGEALGDWMLRTSEGNPYMLVELVRHARERGMLDPGGDLSVFSADPVVPQTIYSLIQSRLARLSESARRVLDAAVVAGRESDFDVVYRAAGLSEVVALDALDELREVGLVRPLDGLRYSFDHSLTMEVAWRQVGEVRHRLLHRRVAEALEAVHAGDSDSVAGLVAWHFAEGNDPQRAAPYAFRAGQQAAGVAAWQEAIAFYEQALAAGDNDRAFVTEMALGEAYSQAGSGAQASEAFRAALALAQDDRAKISAAKLALVRSLLPQARFAEMIAIAGQIAADPASSPADVIRAEQLWGTALSVGGADLAGAAEHLRRAESLLRPADPSASQPTDLLQITFELGSVLAQQGDLPGAVAYYREVLEAARQPGDTVTLPWAILAHNNLGYHLHLLGDPAAAEHARTGLAMAREGGFLSFQPYLLSTLGEIAVANDDLLEAERLFSEGLKLAERLNVPERVAGLTANLGLVAQRCGETALAIYRLSTALVRADTLGTRHLAAQIRIWLAPLLPRSEASAHLAAARAIAESGQRQRLLDEIAVLEAR